jgi:predicted secreted protein
MRLTVLLASALMLTACNNDILSTKPETDAEVPAEPAPPAADTPVTPVTPALPPAIDPPPPAEPVAITAPILNGPIPTDRTTVPIPFTDKKVRSLRNDATMTLNTGQTLTVVLNVNTTEGFDWLMAPVPAGVTLYGDYYRPDAVAAGVPNIGGARSFLFRGETPGRYPISIQHTNGTEIRATKSFWIDVSTPAPAPAPVPAPAPSPNPAPQPTETTTPTTPPS